MDVLSDLLNTVRLESKVFVQTELLAPWGIRAAPRESMAFHAIARGRAWLEIDGLAPVEVEAGDFLLIRSGVGHSLRDALDSPTRDIMDLVASGEINPRSEFADAARTTQLICGQFLFTDLGNDRLLAALPTVLHTGEFGNDVGPWLAQTMRLLTYESFDERPGAGTVVNRLCDALFVYVVRSHLASLAADKTSWLRALVDPEIGAALRMMHDDPAAPWTVATLAAKVGRSRSAFSARFTQLVGDSPMRYLIDWRLRKAAAMLRDGAAIGAVSMSAGYDSPAAFSKAFRRATGTSPGAYRARLS